jgi:isopentenyl phosphate kinase
MLTFLKLGGSLITDKTRPETPRGDEIARLSVEIARALAGQDAPRLVVGHGSGSFGHVVASRYGTRQGVESPEDWRGFAEVSVVAARLNHIVLEALASAGVPVFRVQPSASALCEDGRITRMELAPIRRALDHGLVPLVYGDVALDEARGGTIISTEEIFHYLALTLKPRRILLAGDYPAVLDIRGRAIPLITRSTLTPYEAALGGSSATDVTGGMAAKVETMLRLCESVPGLTVQVFDGSQPGAVMDALLHPDFDRGTRITAV